MRSTALLALLATAGFIAAGCGSGEESDARSTVSATVSAPPDRQPTEARMPSRPAAAAGARIEVADSQFGSVVADRHGEALYLFDRERGGKSACYGACASVWPPVLTKGKPVAAGASQGLLGTTRRANGKLQVTYAGHPLYYYVGDSPGTILCHDVVEFGGTWLVVKPDGQAAA